MMRRKIITEGIILVIMAILSFSLAKNFYNDPLLKGGVEFLGVPLYISISFFLLLYIAYRIMRFIVKAMKK